MRFLQPVCEYCREYHGWGMNFTTFVFLAIVLISMFQAWGLYCQGKIIRVNRRAESVSIPMFTFFASFLTTTLIYGVAVHSAAMVINGLLSLFYVYVLVGLWKYKGFTLFNRILGVALLAMIAIMILGPWKQGIYFVSSLGCIGFGMMQPCEMWWRGSARDVGVEFIITSLVSTFFWCFYGFAISDPVLSKTSPFALAVLITSLCLWLKYPKE